MKKIICIIILIPLLFSSCEKVLDRKPLDRISDAVVWNDPTLVDAYILDIYSRMLFQNNEQAQSPSGRNYAFLINIVTDQATNGRNWSATVNKYQKGLIDQSGGWEQWYYDDIRRTNEYFAKIKDSTIPKDQVKIFNGRVKLARALYYFEMVKWYGGIPLITEAQPIDKTIEQLQVPRNTEQEVYDFILSECDDIINNKLLPETATRKGDPTIYVAYALKSRAALYAASIARWGQVKINGLVGIPNDQEQRYWQISYDASKAIMNGPFSLYKKDSDPSENYRKLFIDEDNPEVIWAKYYDGVSVTNEWSISNGVIGWTASYLTQNINPYLEFVDDYENKDGTITPLDRQTVTNKLWTYDELFGNKEPRFQASIFTQGSNWNGFNPVQIYHGIRTSTGTILRSGSYNGIPANGANYSPYVYGFGIKKGVDPNESTATNSGKVMRIQFRLGEILLNYAEAAFYLNKNDDALNAVNQIRARVNLPAYTTIDEAKIRHERKIELAFEGLRHWDLKRWRIAVSAISRSWTSLNYVLDAQTGKFLVEFVDKFRTSSFTDKLYYFPITASRISNDPALAPENPGY